MLKRKANSFFNLKRRCLLFLPFKPNHTYLKDLTTTSDITYSLLKLTHSFYILLNNCSYIPLKEETAHFLTVLELSIYKPSPFLHLLWSWGRQGSQLEGVNGLTCTGPLYTASCAMVSPLDDQPLQMLYLCFNCLHTSTDLCLTFIPAYSIKSFSLRDDRLVQEEV